MSGFHDYLSLNYNNNKQNQFEQKSLLRKYCYFTLLLIKMYEDN